MYASFFGLNEKPFSITPDPRYLFLSERHAEALAHLVYGINEAGGFIQLNHGKRPGVARLRLGDGFVIYAPTDQYGEKSAELIATFNGILDNDGLSFYPDWPAPGFYDVIVQELQGLVTGVQDVETTNANLGEQYDEGTAEFR